jgi:cellulose synthase/poly-beta-1,6-N-acetylglucosamine synthase-like glycosyltransferase
VKGRVIFFPMPIAWTEVPEVYVSLGKQRGRWYRGLWECITYHRAVLFNPRYKQLGLFALPYQFLFEAMAPLLEGIGYMIVPITWAVGILDTYFLFLFLIVAIGFNILISSLSVAVGLWSEGRAQKGYYAASLLPFTVKDVAWLVWYGILSNFGYRQYIVYYQLKGFKDFLAGKKSWDKFARKGFQNTNAG